MPLSFTTSYTQRSYAWTQWKTVYASKGGVYQYYDDGTSTTVYFYDGPEIHVAVMWDGTVPQGIINGGYSQAQNNADLTDFQTNWQPGGNKRISGSDNGIPVLFNSTVTANGSQVYTGFGNREVTLVINIKNAPTGTSPTLQFTLQEVDAGDQATTIGTSVTGAVINAAGTQEITLNLTISNTVKCSWTIGGTGSPTFTGVYVTVVAKVTTVISGIDNTGTERYVGVKAGSTAAVASDQSLVTAFSPNSPLPNGSNVIGALTANQSVNVAQVAGSSTSTAATGVQKVGVVGGTGTSLETTVGVLDHNLKNVSNAAVATAASGVQKVGVVGSTGTALDGTTAGILDENIKNVGGSAVVTAATGVQKVGIVGGTGTSLETTAGVVDHNLKNVGNAAVATLGAGEQKVAVEGLAAAGSAPSGNPIQIGVVAPSGNMIAAIGGSSGAQGIDIMANEFIVQSNATVTSSSSTLITKSLYGVQQINLVVNVTGSITGTTPTLTYTIQEIDPGNGTTTFGNSASTIAISAAGVYTATLTATTSSAVKVSWTIGGSASPTFNGVYSTVVGKATPTTQAVSTSPSNTTPGIALGNITTSAKTNVAVQASVYNEQSANFTGSIKSASANDTSAGTGARTVIIYYVDSTGSTSTTETVTLNGTTAVNLVNTNHCFIEKMVVATVGSGGSNAGAITLFTGAAGAGTAVAIINTGDNETFLGHHYVVSGKTCHVTDFTGTTNSSNETLFTIQAIPIPVANQVSLQISDWVTGSQTNQTQRTFSSTVNIAGPARLQLFGAPGSTSSMTSYGSFTFFDQ